MRRLFAVLVMLFAGLAFTGQAVASVSASYSDCCLLGCKDMAQCASATCQACAVPQLAPAPAGLHMAVPRGLNWLPSYAAFDAGCRAEPWTPPD